MRTTLILVAAILGLSVSLRAANNTSLSIMVAQKKSASGHILIQFTIQNVTQAPLRIFTALLPWKSSSSSNFILRTRGGKLLEFGQPNFGFPPPGDAVIKPNETIDGEIDLSALFPEGDKLPASGTGLLYWSYWYDPDSETHKDRELYGGVLTLSDGK
jgi:hypothetical protein